MNTQVLQPTQENVELAAKLILQGEVVGIPTETVYGLAASSFNSQAVKKIFKAKMRPQDNPLISHISNVNMLDMVATDIPQSAYVLAKKFWPGPLTMVLKRSKLLADEVCAGLDTAAVRMPNHKAALDIISACNVPLAAPSANLSGSPSTTTAKHVLADLNGKIPLIIDGGACMVGVESTVVSLVGEKPVLLRPGAVTKEQIEDALQCEVLLSNAVLNELEKGETPSSPGMKYKHYAPKAKIILVKSDLQKFNAYVAANAKQNTFRLCFKGEEETSNVPCVTYGNENLPNEQANQLFAALRMLDEVNAQTVYARCPLSTGVSMAVYNRLLRAAAFNVVEL